MFWGATYSPRSEIDRLLEEGENDEPVTLERLFAEPAFSSELRTNIKLQDYLALPAQLLKVIKYAFLEPSQELIFDPNVVTDDNRKWGPETPSRVSVTRAVFVSSDVLSINSVSITRAIVENENFIDEILFPPLSRAEGVSPLVAERLFKFVERLFSQKRDELNSYLKPRWRRLLPLLISHFRNRTIVDLTVYLWMISDPLYLFFAKDDQIQDFKCATIGQLLNYLFSDTEEQEFAYQFILDILNFPLGAATEFHPAANLVNILMNPCITHQMVFHLCNKISSQTLRLNILHVLSQLLQWPPSQEFGISEVSRQIFIFTLLEHLGDLKQLIISPLIILDKIENSTGTFVPLGALRFNLGIFFTQLIKVAFYYQTESYPDVNFEEIHSKEHDMINRCLSVEKKPEIFQKYIHFSLAINDILPSNLSKFNKNDAPLDTSNITLKRLDQISGSVIQSQLQSNQSIANLICEEIQKHLILKWFIDTFFEYPWHNIFHNLFCDFIYYILHWSLDPIANPVHGDKAPLISAGQSLLVELFTQHFFITKALKIASSPDVKLSAGYSEHLKTIIMEIKDLVDKLKSYNEPIYCQLESLILSAIEDQGWSNFSIQSQKGDLSEEETSLFGKTQVKKLFQNEEIQLSEHDNYSSYNSTDINEDNAYNNDSGSNSSDEFQFECSSDEEICSPRDDNTDKQLSCLLNSTEIDETEENHENFAWHDEFNLKEDSQELSDLYTPRLNSDSVDLNVLARSYSCDNLLGLGEELWFKSKSKVDREENTDISYSSETKMAVGLDSNLSEENFETILL